MLRLSSLCHNSLHGAGAYTELAGDGLNPHAFGAVCADFAFDGCRDPRSTQRLALRSGASEPRLCSSFFVYETPDALQWKVSLDVFRKMLVMF